MKHQYLNIPLLVTDNMGEEPEEIQEFDINGKEVNLDEL